MSDQHPSDIILHQDDVEEVINEEIAADAIVQNAIDDATYALLGTDTVVSPTAPGATYDQTEAASMKTAVDAIISALVASGVLVEG